MVLDHARSQSVELESNAFSLISVPKVTFEINDVLVEYTFAIIVSIRIR
jgi:hypothetical protein